MSNLPSRSSIQSYAPALLFLGIFIVLLVLLMPDPQVSTTALPTSTTSLPTAIAALPSTLPPTSVVAAYDAVAFREGQGVYQLTCSTCHGIDARGIPGLGKNLIDSPFVHGLTDDELLHFVATGRDTSDPLSTTGIPMPPRGGNPSLTDEQINSIIAYLRSEAATQGVPMTVLAGGQAVATVTPHAAQADPILPTSIPVTPSPFSAQIAYTWSCAGCHGVDGKGNEPFAAGFETSNLLRDRASLLAFLIEGRPLADPRIEFSHPPQGGYPALTDEQLSVLSDYVISIIVSDS